MGGRTRPRPNRRRMRLEKYDYTHGSYFVTICTQGRQPYFLKYPNLTAIVYRRWFGLENRFGVGLDEFVIMRNHVHGIIHLPGSLLGGGTLGPGVPARDTPAGDCNSGKPDVRVSLGEIIGSYKSLCVTEWLGQIRETGLDAPGLFWQRNYYERAIRDEEGLRRVRRYIRDNPLHAIDAKPGLP